MSIFYQQGFQISQALDHALPSRLFKILGTDSTGKSQLLVNLKELDSNVASKFRGDNLLLDASFSKEQGTLDLTFKTRNATIKSIKFTSEDGISLPSSSELLMLLRTKNSSNIYDFRGSQVSHDNLHSDFWSKFTETLNEII